MKKLHILLFAIVAHNAILYPKSKKTTPAPIAVNLAVDNIKNLTPQQLKTLSLEQIKNLNEQQIAALSYDQLATFTTQKGPIKIYTQGQGKLNNKWIDISNTLYFWLSTKQKLSIPQKIALQLIEKGYDLPSVDMVLFTAKK